MILISEEQALKDALAYIADCLERNEVYTVNNDSFVTGEGIKPILADFARKLASGKQLQKWREWCSLKGNASHG